MESDRTTIRLPKDLKSACDKLAVAAGLSIGEWLRSLAEKETGIVAVMPRGTARCSRRRRREIARNANAARWAKQEGSAP